MTTPPCTVGLTGGLASGKSSAARLLTGRGAAVLDADRVVHDLYRAGRSGATAVASLFGAGLLLEDGSVDRGALARRLAGDAAAIAELNAAVHPLVRREVAAWLEQLVGRPDPSAVAVVEAALLVESGGYRGYDLLAVVWCRPDQQLARAVARGTPEARARELMAAQATLEERRRLADVLIDNSGSPARLAEEVERAWVEIERLCAERVKSEE